MRRAGEARVPRARREVGLGPARRRRRGDRGPAGGGRRDAPVGAGVRRPHAGPRPPCALRRGARGGGRRRLHGPLRRPARSRRRGRSARRRAAARPRRGVHPVGGRRGRPRGGRRRAPRPPAHGLVRAADDPRRRRQLDARGARGDLRPRPLLHPLRRRRRRRAHRQRLAVRVVGRGVERRRRPGPRDRPPVAHRQRGRQRVATRRSRSCRSAGSSSRASAASWAPRAWPPTSSPAASASHRRWPDPFPTRPADSARPTRPAPPDSDPRQWVPSRTGRGNRFHMRNPRLNLGPVEPHCLGTHCLGARPGRATATASAAPTSGPGTDSDPRQWVPSPSRTRQSVPHTEPTPQPRPRGTSLPRNPSPRGPTRADLSHGQRRASVRTRHRPRPEAMGSVPDRTRQSVPHAEPTPQPRPRGTHCLGTQRLGYRPDPTRGRAPGAPAPWAGGCQPPGGS